MIKLLVVVLASVVGCLVLFMISSSGSDAAERSGAPLLRFECSVYKTLRMDPIFRERGQSTHLHHFVGNPHVQFDSTGWKLAAHRPTHTTCTRLFETSAVWFPTLYDDSGRLPVTRFVWYFRGLGSQQSVITPPRGLELIGRDEKGDVEWGCGEGQATEQVPPGPNGSGPCPAGQDVRLAIAFPNCLRDPVGSKKPDVRWEDGRNVSYVGGGRCQNNYLPLPEERISIDFENTNGIQGQLRVSAENGKTKPAATSAHADIMHGEQQPEFNFYIDRCIRDAPDNGTPPDFCRNLEPAPNPDN